MKKIKVKKEGREGIYLVEKEEIKTFIKRKKFREIHSYSILETPTKGTVYIGTNIPIKTAVEQINNSERMAILTEKSQSQNHKHMLSLVINNSLKLFDVGKIVEENLEIID